MKNKCLKSMKLSIMLFLLLFVLHSIVYMTKNMFSAAMASIVEEGIMTKSQTGAISAAFWLMYAVFQILGGFAADKYSPSKLIILGLISGICANFIIYLNQSYSVIMAVWCINAVFQFGLWPGVFKIVSTQIKIEFRDTAIFWILLSTSVGQALSMIVASFVSKWQQNFIVSAIALFIILILWIVIYNPLEKQMEESEIISVHNKTEKVQKTKIGIKELMLCSGLPIILIICFLVMTVSSGMKIMTPVMLMESYSNLPAAIATRLSVILIIFSTLGMFLVSFIRNKITKNEMSGSAILLTVSIPSLIISCFVGKIHYLIILALLSFSMAFIQGAYPLTNSFPAARFTLYGRSGTISGILNAASSLGNVFASYVFARMAELIPWNSVVITWTVLIAASTLLSLALIRYWSVFINKKNN